MSRFNVPAQEADAEEKAPSVRVCLFVDPDLYRHLKAQCVLDGTNVSQWFNARAREHLKLAKAPLTRRRR